MRISKVLRSGVLMAVVASVSACGSNVHASPPGLSDHLPGNTANAPANQTGGTCGLFTTAQIQAIFGGEVSRGQADNLTPGVDRCNWTITKSHLSLKAIELSAVRPITATPARTEDPKASTAVAGLPRGATYSSLNRTLTYTNGSKALSLELIAPGQTKISAGMVKADLIRLAQGR